MCYLKKKKKKKSSDLDLHHKIWRSSNQGLGGFGDQDLLVTITETERKECNLKICKKWLNKFLSWISLGYFKKKFHADLSYPCSQTGHTHAGGKHWFPFVFTEMPCGPAVVTEVETGSTFWLPQSTSLCGCYLHLFAACTKITTATHTTQCHPCPVILIKNALYCKQDLWSCNLLFTSLPLMLPVVFFAVRTMIIIIMPLYYPDLLF